CEYVPDQHDPMVLTGLPKGAFLLCAEAVEVLVCVLHVFDAPGRCPPLPFYQCSQTFKSTPLQHPAKTGTLAFTVKQE
ncbi:MAG: hypothetical protein ACJAUZ_003304, partial [Flavobacteriaceae bacterium]